LKRLIVNADDFGRHELINKGVEQAVEKGILRSATLMPGAKAFDSAVEIGKSHPQLGVGIHFTLVNGYPVLPPSEIPSLVTEEGVFVDDHTAFVKKLVSGHVNMQEVRAELSAQLRRMENTGLNLTHVDSHQHMHTLPGVINVVLDLAKEAGIRAVRIPKAPLFSGEFGGIGQLVGRLGLGTLARLAGGKAHSRGLAYPDYFAGIVAGEAVSEAALLKVVSDLKEGTTEVMMHPGSDNGQLIPATGWDHDFEAEYQAMTSPAVMQLVKKHQVEIVNFRSLYNGQ